MSYDLKRSHFSVILERIVTAGLTITEEGQVLVAVLDASTGTETVAAAAGAGGEIVVGFSIRDNADNATTSSVEDHVIPAATPFVFTLDNNDLIATQIRIVGSTTGVLTEGDPGANADEFSVADDTGIVTVNSATAGETATVTYRYNLSVAEARLLFFQRNINNEAGALFGQVGVGHGHGEIFTDQFDALIDWSGVAAGAIRSAAAGTITEGGGGGILDARVISVPNVDNPLLGISFDIGGATGV